MSIFLTLSMSPFTKFNKLSTELKNFSPKLSLQSVNTSTFKAPLFFKTFAHSLTVDPLVYTSSINKRFLSLILSGLQEKVPFIFLCRSFLVSRVWGGAHFFLSSDLVSTLMPHVSPAFLASTWAWLSSPAESFRMQRYGDYYIIIFCF